MAVRQQGVAWMNVGLVWIFKFMVLHGLPFHMLLENVPTQSGAK
jgi:hypothetical protein